jgi:hypothetical protein
MPGRSREDGPWPLLTAGLLRKECGLTVAAAARASSRPASSITDAARSHRELLLMDSAYAQLAVAALVEALNRMYDSATFPSSMKTSSSCSPRPSVSWCSTPWSGPTGSALVGLTRVARVSARHCFVWSVGVILYARDQGPSRAAGTTPIPSWRR